ncbi:hypothetical protein HAHE_26510 [Haloferula helveola]|uniref:Uncharacterized protein n=1 Tax=Haloferula helveola TaxID=490095 RepID=A0ABN6H9V1_9BACT|nr:hypothetical protein HAHE_26510 [Haloferula helveola]
MLDRIVTQLELRDRWNLGLEAAVARLNRHVEIELSPHSQVIELRVVADDAGDAVAICEAVERNFRSQLAASITTNRQTLEAAVTAQRARVREERRVLTQIERNRPFEKAKEEKEAALLKLRNEERLLANQIECLEQSAGDGLVSYASAIQPAGHHLRVLETQLLHTRFDIANLRSKGLSDGHPLLLTLNAIQDGVATDLAEEIEAMRLRKRLRLTELATEIQQVEASPPDLPEDTGCYGYDDPEANLLEATAALGVLTASLALERHQPDPTSAFHNIGNSYLVPKRLGLPTWILVSSGAVLGIMVSAIGWQRHKIHAKT